MPCDAMRCHADADANAVRYGLRAACAATPVELGASGEWRVPHLPNSSALSCEAVPINRDCRGIESYDRSSFLSPFRLPLSLLRLSVSSACLPLYWALPFFGIFLAPRGLWGNVRLTALYVIPPSHPLFAPLVHANGVPSFLRSHLDIAV